MTVSQNHFVLITINRILNFFLIISSVVHCECRKADIMMLATILISVFLVLSATLSLKHKDKVSFLGNDFTQEQWLHHTEMLHKQFTEGNWV